MKTVRKFLPLVLFISIFSCNPDDTIYETQPNSPTLECCTENGQLPSEPGGQEEEKEEGNQGN
ncbi:hypothetical protein [uncultured Winogradskyella sp.]|uniref:hypothetical protein n=1 Tax=uncultured Winogradskyella sp. TaxID=395353 RepID=UPI0026053714|nr:hypothetical protein [uncultured Winogradskyella sp.]